MQVTKSCSTIVSTLILLVLTGFISSCHCKGCDEVYDIDAIKITAADSMHFPGNNNNSLGFTATVSYHDGDRKCMVKTMTVCAAAIIDTASIHVTCDKALAYGGQVLQPQTDLWRAAPYTAQTGIFNDGFSFGASLMLDPQETQHFTTGLYHFYFSASSVEGEQFSDSTAVYIY